MLQYFGFKEDPFGVNPDPRCLYLTRTHRQSLEALEFGFSSNRGFTAMIAPPGMGKTTLLFRFLEDIRDSARAVFLFDLDSQCEPAEFVAHILRDLGITPARGSAKMHDQLSDAVIKENRAGRKFVIVIDEAQNLSDAVLERVRLLTNFETSRGKLIQIVLSGQSQLSDKLLHSSLVQLRQRISTICHIESLSAEETLGYIDYRLKLAGYLSDPLFTAGAIKLIAEASHGTPRTINNLCFNALALCAKMNLRQVDAAMVSKVIAALQLVPQSNTQVTPVVSVPVEAAVSAPVAAAVSVPVVAAVSESAEPPRKRREFEFSGLRLTPQPGDSGPARPNESADRPAEPRFWERTRLRLVHLATATVGSVMLWVPAAALILVLSFAGVLRLTEVLAPSSHDQTTDLTVPQPSTSDDPAATESTSPPDPGAPIANPDSAPAAAPKPQASASIPKPSPIIERAAAPIAMPTHADASMPTHSEPAASSSGSNQKSLQDSATEPMPSAPAQPVVMAPQANVQPPSVTSSAIPQQAPAAPAASAPKQVRSALNGNAPQPIAQDTTAPSVRPALPQP